MVALKGPVETVRFYQTFQVNNKDKYNQTQVITLTSLVQPLLFFLHTSQVTGSNFLGHKSGIVGNVVYGQYSL